MADPLIPPLQWREGMFLRPHHFQYQQRQSGQHLSFLLDTQFPHRWGVIRLALDERALPTGIFRVAECAAILRDGLIVTSDLLAKPLELDLKPLQASLKGKYTGIYLSVARPARAEVTDFTSKVPPEATFPRRWRPVAREAVDANTGESPQPIDCLLQNAGLLHEGEDRSGFECLKIAEVTHREDSYQLNPEYAPPSALSLPGTPTHQLASRVLADLQEGARYVIGLFSQQASGTREAVSLETRLKVHGLLGTAPHLEGLLGSGAARPFDLYLALCRVLGDLVGLQADAELIPESVAPYNHEDLAGTFGALKKCIDACLRPIIRRKYPDYPFRPAGGAQGEEEFLLDDFRQEWLTRPLFIAAYGPRSMAETRRWMENCLIGAPLELGDFRRKRIQGLDRAVVEDPPPEIGFKREWAIYRLAIDPKIHGPIIEGIKKETKLAVKSGWQGDAGIPPPQRLTLIVKVDEEGPARAGKTNG